MLAKAIAGAFDLDDDRVVEEAVEKGRSDNMVAEHFSPIDEAAVRCQDHDARLVASVDELEEQAAATRRHWKMADLVDDEERSARQEANALLELSFAFGLDERGDHVGQRLERDAFSGLHGFDRERGCEVALASAGRPCSPSATMKQLEVFH